ncbi:MAG: type III pantothenate kinase [Endomicrobia bacterium]|nr:type III pantothenate kinase [Endomicrobiia bacterium]
MKILCDVGNTNVKFIILTKNSYFFKKLPKEKFVFFIEKFKKEKHLYIYVCSVVEEINKKLKEKFKNIIFIDVKILKKFISINYDIKKLGIDRLLSAYAAKKMFGNNLVIVSCGTTIFLDYINKNGAYMGGEIFPGIKLLLECLYLRTSKLPRIEKIKSYNYKELVGHNTYQCIQKGISNFVISGIKNFLETLSPQKVVVTGGDLMFIVCAIKGCYNKKLRIVEDLALIGIIFFMIDYKMLEFKEIKILKKFIGRHIDNSKKI